MNAHTKLAWTTPRRWLGSLVLLAGLFFHAAPPVDRGALLVYDFDLSSIPASNVDRLRGLGFDGLVTRCSRTGDLARLTGYANHVASIDDFRVLAYVDYDFNHPDSPLVWRAALPILATLNAPLWVIVKNAPTMPDVDALLLTMAQESELQGVPLVLYPHWDTDIETAAEAAARAAQVAHPNIHVSLHTCHEIRGGNQYSMEAVVAAHAPDTRLVTIAGADHNAYTGGPPHSWDDAIKPLDRGDYSLLPFLRALERANYDGPVILHTWGLAGDPGHHSRSLATYARYRNSL